MEKYSSSWFRVQSVPDSYAFPPESRPGKLIVPLCKSIPVIDLGNAIGQDQTDIIQKILEASENFGIFQVINHGVSENLILDTMRMFKEFFCMTAEDKESVVDKSGLLYLSSTGLAKDGAHLWRENLKCHPLEKCMQFSPEKPNRYREVVGRYSVEVRKLLLRILELICEGLGLQPGYFGEELTKEQLLSVNHFPPCPDPSLTLGLPKHSDPHLITILQQEDVYGLQVFKDGQWIGVEPLPNALVVIIGYQLQIISNGKLKSAEHRAVTNSNNARTTIVSFISPCHDSIVEPAKALISGCSPPLYRAFQYKEFFADYTAKSGDSKTVLEPYKLQA